MNLIIAAVGFLLALAGAVAVVCSYVAMAESRGVLRFFAYDRLSRSGKKAWAIGYGLIIMGSILLLLSLLASGA